MLKTKLLHPEILRVLASSGHFSQVLIAIASGCSRVAASRIDLRTRVDCARVKRISRWGRKKSLNSDVAVPFVVKPSICQCQRMTNGSDRLEGPAAATAEHQRWHGRIVCRPPPLFDIIARASGKAALRTDW